MDKFWGDRCLQMEGWATPEKHAQAMNNNMLRKSHSTSGSESSFTVSTQDSPSLSAQSEASSIAGKYMLQSPDLSEARFHRITVCNRDTKHSRSLSMGSAKGELTKMEKQQHWMLLQQRGLSFENIHLASDLDASPPLDVQIEPFVKANERLVQSPGGLVHDGTESLSDKGWLSDGTDESWASASSQELSWNHSCDEADDLHPSILQETSRSCSTEDSITFHDGIVGSGKGETVCGTVEREACTRHPYTVNKANESANNKPTHLKSRHSAAVEDKFPSSSLHGYFRFVEHDGSPCYSFSVNDSDEVFFARACGPESHNNKEDSNCVYTFHSRKDDGRKATGGWKSWLKKEKLASSLVGKMKVFDSWCIDRDRNRTEESKCVKETHFVLYGERCLDQMSAQHASKLLTSDSTASKSKFYSMPMLGSHSQNLKHRADANASQGLIRSHLHEPISRESMSKQGSDDSEAVRCLKHATAERDRMNMELAAIAITTSIKEHKVTGKKAHDPSLKERPGWGTTFLKKSSEKGWGLGFLKSSEIRCRPSSPVPSEEDSRPQPPVLLEEDHRQQVNEAPKDICEGDTEKLRHHTDLGHTYPRSCHIVNEKLAQKLTSSKGKEPKTAVDVVVILPAGHHGVPRICPSKDDDSYGPTPLLECWKSGGNCDCGGWDMGCGLSVLKAQTLILHKKRETIALTSRDRINWISPGKPLKIFTQGYKQKKLLMLEIIQAGLFTLSFQARLSPLQAFATAVAIFHQQITHK